MSGLLNNSACLPGEEEGDRARFLELCASQLQTAVEDAKQKSELVSRAAITTAGRLAELGAAGNADAADAAEAMNSLFVHLQFADRLDQQVSNVRKNLLLLAGFVAGDEADWAALLERARGSYTMEDERRAFDRAFGGPAHAAAAADERIELFGGGGSDD